MLTIAVSLSAAGQNLLVFAVPGLDRIIFKSMILTQQRLQSNGVDFINHFSTAPAQGSSNAVRNLCTVYATRFTTSLGEQTNLIDLG